MFSGCKTLTNLELNSFNTVNVTDMSAMFNYCPSLKNLDVSNFKTNKVTTMYDMFRGCTSLTNLDVSTFYTANVTDMSAMFSGCSSLIILDVSNFNTVNVTDMSRMFSYCNILTTIYSGNGWSTDRVTKGQGMFYNCTSLVGGAGTTYDASHADKTYAHIDGGPSNPGYLTYKKASPKEVCDADDAQRWIDNLKSNEPAEMILCDEPTFDDDVEVDDAQIWIDGSNQNPQPVIVFFGGFINIHQNAVMSFKGVTFADTDAAVATLLRAVGNGGIRNSGTLAFEDCTFRQGNYTIENSGTASVGENIAGCRLLNKAGGRVKVTSPLTDDLTVVIATAVDVEQGVAIVTGVSSEDHIMMSLPEGYAYKYDATAGGIVVYSTTDITSTEQQKTVVESYDVTGRKAGKNAKGMRIQRMSDGTIQKTF